MLDTTAARRNVQLYVPAEDGITHIRIGPNGLSEIGKKLGALAPVSFKVYGEGTFRTFENYWQYVRSGCREPRLQMACGAELERLSMRTPRWNYGNSFGFRERILEGLLARFECNPALRAALIATGATERGALPLVRYSVTRDEDGEQVVYVNQDQPWAFQWLDCYRFGQRR